MRDRLFGVSLRQNAVPQPAGTDSAAPIPRVPLYYFHSFEQPFCADALCSCHARRQEAVKVFVSIIEGRVQIEQAATLLVEHGKEGCA